MPTLLLGLSPTAAGLADALHLTAISNLGSTLKWIVVMKRRPVQAASTERELARITFALLVMLFMMLEGGC